MFTQQEAIKICIRSFWKSVIASFEIMAQNGTGKSDFFKQVEEDSAGSFQPEKVSCPGLGTLAWSDCFPLGITAFLHKPVLLFLLSGPSW